MQKDKGEAEETWTTRKDSSLALQCLQETGLEWDERIPAIMKRTPPGTIVDYKITWRDPNPTWTSPGGRVIKIGDAAHAFIPNSTNGATQAMEDGISLAACLKLSGKNNITLATRVHTKLRYKQLSPIDFLWQSLSVLLTPLSLGLKEVHVPRNKALGTRKNGKRTLT